MVLRCVCLLGQALFCALFGAFYAFCNDVSIWKKYDLVHKICRSESSSRLILELAFSNRIAYRRTRREHCVEIDSLNFCMLLLEFPQVKHLNSTPQLGCN